MLKKKIINEPSSWEDILIQRQSERNNPPDKKYYLKEKLIEHKEGGIFPNTTEDFESSNTIPINIDTSIYNSTSIYEIDEVKPRKFKPSKDHGLDLLSWDKNSKKELSNNFNKTSSIRANYNNDKKEFDIVTGNNKKSQFKSTINEILFQKELSQKISKNRTFDPISNTFPTNDLENQRSIQDNNERNLLYEYTLNKMPPNERRVHESMVNIITGETKNEEIAQKFIHEFPNNNINRNKIAILKEQEIIQNRELTINHHNQQTSCRFNNLNRTKDNRDFDIINGNLNQNSNLNESVKFKPNIWDWCQTEALNLN